MFSSPSSVIELICPAACLRNLSPTSVVKVDLVVTFHADVFRVGIYRGVSWNSLYAGSSISTVAPQIRCTSSRPVVNFRLPLERCQVEMFHQRQISLATNFCHPLERCQVELFRQCPVCQVVNFRHPLEECQFPRSVSCLFPLERCQVELFRQCPVCQVVNFLHPLEECQFPRLVSCLFPLEECQMELFHQCQVSRSMSCHLYHHCLVVFPQEVHCLKTSLASPRKKLGTLTLNSSRH